MPAVSRFCGAAFFALFAKWIPPLLANNDPTVTVEVLELFRRHVLFEINPQHLFEILLGGSAGREAVVVDVLLDAGKIDWYVYHPSAADYDSLRQAIGQYLSMFRERTPEWAQDGPKLVFICAPLRDDVEKNIEFARQKAQEVFADGDIPICPHLLFPPITDPKHPEQDKKVKEMSLRLLESCQQLNVYGPIWTDDMWKHIYRAGDLGIPVMTDQKAIGRTPPRRSGRKER